MFTVILTPDCIWFYHIDETTRNKLIDKYPQIELSAKGRYFIQDKPEKLYNVLYELSEEFEIDLR